MGRPGAKKLNSVANEIPQNIIQFAFRIRAHVFSWDGHCMKILIILTEDDDINYL